MKEKDSIKTSDKKVPYPFLTSLPKRISLKTANFGNVFKNCKEVVFSSKKDL